MHLQKMIFKRDKALAELEAERKKCVMMAQIETQWDKILKIKTTGPDDSHSDQYNYPYEPSPYCVLERLASWLNQKERIQYWIMGQGKGRVCFTCPIKLDANP